MTNLSEYFRQAREGRWAIGHFNFATADVLRAIVQGAQAGGAPCVMVGTSEGEAEFIGLAQAGALVGAVREASQFPVFLNADHFKTFEACKAAADAGYDSLLFDGNRLTFEENIAQTLKVRDYLRSAHPGIALEGELGYMKGSSEVQKSVTVGPDDYTKPDQAAEYVRQTGVDRLAVVFGNIHGIVTEQEEHLDIPHLERLVAAVPDVPLVLHGASGLPDSEVAAAVKAGITNVHFNTELRLAYQQGIKDELAAEPGQTTPYKLLAKADENVREIVEHKVRLFMGRQP